MMRKSTIIMSDDKVYCIFSFVMWAVLSVLMGNLMFQG